MGHVANTGFERADTAADSRPFVHRVPAHTPEWTNYNDGDPSTGLLEVPSFLTSDVFAHGPDQEATRTPHVELPADTPPSNVDLPDLNGADAAIVADSIRSAGAAIFADSLESMRVDVSDSDYARWLELPPLTVDSVSGHDLHTEGTQAHSAPLTDAVQPDVATAFADASASFSVDWLF
jgi:hypothetical protein